jgi:hypothetical protein
VAFIILIAVSLTLLNSCASARKNRLHSVNNGDSFDTPMTDAEPKLTSGGIPSEISAQKFFSCAKHLSGTGNPWRTMTF